NKLPRSINVLGEKVFVTWKSAPAYCTFCKKTGHKRPHCKDLVLADLSISSLLQQVEETDETTPTTQPEDDSQQTSHLQNQMETSQSHLPTQIDSTTLEPESNLDSLLTALQDDNNEFTPVGTTKKKRNHSSTVNSTKK